MRTAILGSGGGSNARALLAAWKAGALGGAEPVLVLSDNPDAGILAHAQAYGVEGRHIAAGPKKTVLEGAAEQAYIAALRAQQVELVVLAGFMRVVKEGLLDAYAGRVINLHPSLLPSFKGLDGIGQAYRYGVKVTGCTVHYVTGELDGGPIIAQRAVSIEAQDDLAAVAAKVHAAEHSLLPEVVRALAQQHREGK